MQKWEYAILAHKDLKFVAGLPDGSFQVLNKADNIGVALNALGAEGWELAGVIENGFTFALKRPKA